MSVKNAEFGGLSEKTKGGKDVGLGPARGALCGLDGATGGAQTCINAS